MQNILDFNRQALRDLLPTWGEPAYRADQIIQWVHQHGVSDFAAMSNLSKSLRQRLQQDMTVKLPAIAEREDSNDGTRKWLLRLDDNNCIETVFIPEADRGTLCISSQVGCILNCSFCSTAQQGFSRNLSVGEIIGQLRLALNELRELLPDVHRPITNVVMMGMGEPLLNFDNVVAALDLMMDDLAYGLAKRRVTVSTSGVVPAMQELRKASDCALAVSLHAPVDPLRDLLVPLNKRYPLKELMAVCRDYYTKASKRQITFEYVMLDGINDQPSHAKQLIRLMEGVPGKINLIPFNPFPGTVYRCSDPATVQAFQQKLQKAGLVTTVRKTRGQDINAACGQLAADGQVSDITKRQQRNARRFKSIPVQLQELADQ